MAYLLSYTRQPIDSVHYDPRLACSMHLALSRDGADYDALNHNSGVLFAKATQQEDGSLNPKSLKVREGTGRRMRRARAVYCSLLLRT